MSRPATISPSQLKPLMAKSGLGKGADTYADKLLMRRLGVDFSDEYESYNMKRGKELEPDAIWLYEQQVLAKVEGKDRYYHARYDYVSGEPDGLIGTDGIIEVKCPTKKWHLANLRTGKQIDTYMLQMQGYMWITSRQWVDFVSYDPRFPEGMEIAVHRVDRDQEMINKIEERCVEFWETIMIPKLKEFDLLEDE